MFAYLYLVIFQINFMLIILIHVIHNSKIFKDKYECHDLQSYSEGTS